MTTPTGSQTRWFGSLRRSDNQAPRAAARSRSISVAIDVVWGRAVCETCTWATEPAVLEALSAAG